MKWFSRRSPHKPASARRARVAVETLEDRALPATGIAAHPAAIAVANQAPAKQAAAAVSPLIAHAQPVTTATPAKAAVHAATPDPKVKAAVDQIVAAARKAAAHYVQDI